MGKRKQKEIKCTVEFTEGAEGRITQGLVDIWMMVRDGRLPCRLLEERMAEYDEERKKRMGGAV